jgi:hypothetical protein
MIIKVNLYFEADIKVSPQDLDLIQKTLETEVEKQMNRTGENNRYKFNFSDKVILFNRISRQQVINRLTKTQPKTPNHIDLEVELRKRFKQ